MPNFIEEFFLAEAVRSEARGELQSTLGAEAFRHNGSDAYLEFEYGITNRLQLSTELPYGLAATPTSLEPTNFSSIGLGGQYQIIRSSQPFALSVGLSAGVPVTARADFDWEPEVLVAKQFHSTQLHASFIADLGEDGHAYTYNLASVTNLHNNWLPTLEFSARQLPVGNQFYIAPGIYRHLPHRLEAGVAAATGSHLGALFKVTWEVGGDDDDDH
jgi:hypothetical protein